MKCRCVSLVWFPDPLAFSFDPQKIYMRIDNLDISDNKVSVMIHTTESFAGIQEAVKHLARLLHGASPN